MHNESVPEIRIKRVYATPGVEDGIRILVDRLWPRGLTKEKARVDIWAKDIAPTTELRHWFHHDAGKWPEFIRRYQEELSKNPALQTIRNELRKGNVTLVYSATAEEHNNAVVLRDYLQGTQTKPAV